MDKTGKDLLKLMFDEKESICVSNNEFGFHSLPMEAAFNGVVTLESPNKDVPIRTCPSSSLLMVAINPINGFRRDEDVTKFRSFLWECDMGSIKDQLIYFEKTNVPLSAQIFSGSRSVHSITTLDEDLPDEKTWRMLNQWGLNILSLCDQNCKNPSRSTRVPGSYREPGKKQELISMGKRIGQKEFIGWLNKYEHLRPKTKLPRIIIEGQADFSRLSAWARSMLTNGIVFKNKGRNQTFYGLAMDLALAGFSEDLSIDLLTKRFVEEHDFKEKELITTIKSAFRAVNDKKG